MAYYMKKYIRDLRSSRPWTISQSTFSNLQLIVFVYCYEVYFDVWNDNIEDSDSIDGI